jgi:hypothetical protein
MLLKRLFVLLVAVLPCSLYAQDADTAFNENYYESFSNLITARTYFSQKYTNFTIASGSSLRNLTYNPNTTLNFGIGATYEWFTLNLAYGFGFLNGNDEKKGETKYLDLQSHIYTRKMTIDFMGQFYKSFYLRPQGNAAPDASSYYIRPDIKVRHFGIAPYYVLNWKKLSLRAPMIQNEWQKKSAGSILLGGDIYYGVTMADSAFVPASLSHNYDQFEVNKIRYFNIGPGAGYAYTHVIDERFYATGAMTISFPLGWHKEWTDNGYSKDVKFLPNLTYRAGIGYNDEKKSFGLMWVNSSFQTMGETGKYKVRTGNVRLTYAYRFTPGPKLKKKLKIFEKKD